MKITLPIFGLDHPKLLKTFTYWQNAISSAVSTLSESTEAPFTVNSFVEAAGNNSQPAATKISSEVNLVISASSGVSDSLQLPSLLDTSIRRVVIVNATSVILNVFPSIDEKINNLSVNTGMQIPANGSAVAYPNKTFNWILG